MRVCFDNSPRLLFSVFLCLLSAHSSQLTAHISQLTAQSTTYSFLLSVPDCMHSTFNFQPKKTPQKLNALMHKSSPSRSRRGPDRLLWRFPEERRSLPLPKTVPPSPPPLNGSLEALNFILYLVPKNLIDFDF